MNVAYSQHDYIKKVRLPNWGRWGQQDSCKPDPNAGAGTLIYELGKVSDDGDDGWGASAVGDAIVAPIDHRDAEEMDVWIKQLSQQSPRHFKVVKARYYADPSRPGYVAPSMMEVDAAVRAIIDLMESNRRTIDRINHLRTSTAR